MDALNQSLPTQSLPARPQKRRKKGFLDKFFPPGVVKDSILHAAIFAVNIVAIYKFGKIAGMAYIALLLIMFWRTEKNYLFFAYLLVISCMPGNFFAESNALDAPFRLPIFTLAPGFSFSTQEMFMLVAMAKAIYSGRKFHPLLESPLKFLFYYVLFLFLFSIAFFGASFKVLVIYVRNFLQYSFLFTLPILMPKKEDVIKFVWILFPFAFFSFYVGMYFFITGDYYVNLFNGNMLRILMTDAGEGRLNFQQGEHMLILFNFIFPLIVSFTRKKGNIYLYLVSFLSYLNILMTATRVWFIVYSLILAGFLWKSKKVGKIVIATVIPGLLILMTISGASGSNSRLTATTDRLFSIFNIGEKQNESTEMMNDKMETRLPKVMRGIGMSPLFGLGFSDIAQYYLDDDIGNFALIAQVGLVGFSLFLYFFYSYYALMGKTRTRLTRINPMREAFMVFIFAFSAFLVAHFGTHQFFGLTLRGYHLYFLSIYLFLSDFFVRYAFDLDKAIKQRIQALKEKQRQLWQQNQT